MQYESIGTAQGRAAMMRCRKVDDGMRCNAQLELRQYREVIDCIPIDSSRSDGLANADGHVETNVLRYEIVCTRCDKLSNSLVFEDEILFKCTDCGNVIYDPNHLRFVQVNIGIPRIFVFDSLRCEMDYMAMLAETE